MADETHLVSEEPEDPRPPSIADLLRRFLGRLAEENYLIRAASAAIMIAAGVFLIEVTIETTQRAAQMLRGQDPFAMAYPTSSTISSTSSSYVFPPSTPPISFVPSAGPYAPSVVQPAPPAYYAPPPAYAPAPQFAIGLAPRIYQIVAAITTLGHLLSVVPVVLAWSSLVRLIGHGVRIFAESILEWPTTRAAGPHGDDRDGVVAQFLKWFRALALSFLALLLAGAIDRSVTLIASFSLSNEAAKPDPTTETTPRSRSNF